MVGSILTEKLVKTLENVDATPPSPMQTQSQWSTGMLWVIAAQSRSDLDMALQRYMSYLNATRILYGS